MRKLLISVAAAAVTMSPLLGIAAPRPSAAIAEVRPGFTRVDGGWEHEGRYEEMRERYWRLPPEARERYNRLQFEIDQLQRRQRHEAGEGDWPEGREIAERIEELRHEQYRILRYAG